MFLMGMFFSAGGDDKFEDAACFISHFSVLFLFRNLSLWLINLALEDMFSQISDYLVIKDVLQIIK